MCVDWQIFTFSCVSALVVSFLCPPELWLSWLQPPPSSVSSALVRPQSEVSSSSLESQGSEKSVCEHGKYICYSYSAILPQI